MAMDKIYLAQTIHTIWWSIWAFYECVYLCVTMRGHAYHNVLDTHTHYAMFNALDIHWSWLERASITIPSAICKMKRWTWRKREWVMGERLQKTKKGGRQRQRMRLSALNSIYSVRLCLIIIQVVISCKTDELQTIESCERIDIRR